MNVFLQEEVASNVESEKRGPPIRSAAAEAVTQESSTSVKDATIIMSLIEYKKWSPIFWGEVLLSVAKFYFQGLRDHARKVGLQVA